MKSFLKESNEALAFSTIQSYKSKNFVFHEGETYRGAYGVRTGFFKLLNLKTDGKESVLHIFTPGELIASAPMFMPITHYHASCICLEDGELTFFPESKTRLTLKKNADVCYRFAALTMSFAYTLKNRLNDLTQRSASERLFHYLESLGAENDSVILPVPKNQLALLLGISPETLSRSLRTLQENGQVHETNGKYKIISSNNY